MAVTDSTSGLKKPRRSRDGLFLGAVVVLGAIVVCLRLFVFQPFSIPSQSMAPTLIPGDYVLVSKVSYGYGPYSLVLVTAGLSRRFPAGWLPQRRRCRGVPCDWRSRGRLHQASGRASR